MDDEITLWLKQLELQPDAAMEKIWNGFYKRLVIFARSKLRDMPRRSVDEEDIAAQALNSFYNGVKSDRFPDLNDRHDLWKILLTIVSRKASHAIRHNMAQKRGGGKVRGESVFLNPDATIGGIQNHAAAPTEAFAGQMVNELYEALELLDDATLKTIAAMKLEGHSNREIAATMDLATRTIDRKLNRIQMIWKTLFDV